MEQYVSNSHKSKESARKSEAAPEKKITKVVSGAKTRQNNTRKLTKLFISEDVSNVKSYIFMDVLVPAIKKAISDIVTDGIDMVLYGESGGRRSSSSNRANTNRVSYRSYYDSRDRRDDNRHSARSSFDYDDISFKNRADVEIVREQMFDLIDEYGFVTVADMYDLAGLPCPYTSNKYGWTSIRNSTIERVRDGYILKLPRVMPID